jgi:1-acyl-sn-glycerol-3-phosphate acyltransferase
MKAQVYKDPRRRSTSTRFHERSRTRDPDWVYDARPDRHDALRVGVLPHARDRAEKVRGDGAVILAPNHFSFMDHFFLGVSIRRKVRFMAKSQLFTPPMQWIYTHGGVFPVRRGYADEDAFITASGILERGGTSRCTARAAARARASSPRSPSAASAGSR